MPRSRRSTDCKRRLRTCRSKCAWGAQRRAELRDQDYFGPALNRTARIMAVGYGGQVLLSDTTTGLVRASLPENTTVKDLGEHHLKGLSNAEHLWQLLAPGLPGEFPVLQSLSTLPNNLPFQLTSFIGRENEIAAIKSSLNTARLVTLTGSGAPARPGSRWRSAANC